MGTWSGRIVLGIVGTMLALSVRALEVNCTDGLDEDGDTLVDCRDPDCAADVACRQRVTRTLVEQRTVPTDPTTAWGNVFYVSWPEIADIPDVANEGTSVPPFQARGCVGTPGGPTVPDGYIDSLDAICVIWMGADPTLQRGLVLDRFDPQVCQYRSSSLLYDGITTRCAGSSFAVQSHEAYEVHLAARGPTPAAYTFTMEGHADPSFTGTVLQPERCAPMWHILQIPYDTYYASSDDILCGIEGVSWVDANGDGDPDTCTGGLFDGSAPLSVMTYDDDPTAAPTGDLAGNDAYIARTAVPTDKGLVFVGPRFPIQPGDAVMVQLRPEQQPVTWLPPRR
jgi:hypothetical protein